MTGEISWTNDEFSKTVRLKPDKMKTERGDCHSTNTDEADILVRFEMLAHSNEPVIKIGKCMQIEKETSELNTAAISRRAAAVL